VKRSHSRRGGANLLETWEKIKVLEDISVNPSQLAVMAMSCFWARLIAFLGNFSSRRLETRDNISGYKAGIDVGALDGLARALVHAQLFQPNS